eukprot:178489-Chlamydomonas_euryale.AAC.1
MSMHASSAASERNWSVWGQIFTKYRTRLELSRGEKMAYIKGNTKPTELSEASMFEEMDLALALSSS